MPPELQILTINAVCLGIAYFGIFPALVPLSLGRLAAADLAVGLVALGTSGALFWDSGTRFWLLVGQTNWFWFALLTLIVMEIPLFLRFARRNGLLPPGGD